MPRIKEVTLDGVTLNISAFSIEQAEELFPASALKRSQEEEISFKKAAVIKSLNGAVPLSDFSSANEWTIDRLNKEIDYVLLQFLFSQIVEFNGMRLVTVSPGEAKAAA